TKADAACVWLWARDGGLCDAPTTLGSSFDASLTEGQIALPAAAFCAVPGYGTLGTAALAGLADVTGDQNVALSRLFERLIERQYAGASSSAILAAEDEVVTESFGGDREAYLAALAQAHLSVSAARAVLADEIRRAALEQKQRVLAPTATAISA